jgi:oligopeptidase B
VRFLPADDPRAPLRVVSPREPDHEYDVGHHDGRFFIRTNRGATNFRVVTTPVDEAGAAAWTEFVAHRPHVKIDAIDLFARHLVLSIWEDGLEQIEVVNLADGARRRLSHPEPVYSVVVEANMVFDTPTLRIAYQSLVTPPSVFEHDMDTGETRLLKQTEVPGGFLREHYVSERIWATATDGVRIPISLVRRRDLAEAGPASLLLYAYGSYGISIPPAFSAARLPLLDRGTTYAIAHVRGGGEFGEPWRAAGRLMRKVTTFTDFIACAEHLVAIGATTPDRLTIQGGSAGGLLVGAVLNLRPDLCARAILQVPFVDVINTMLDPSLPLTTSEYTEWGNPRERDAFDYILSYSPYDNIAPAAYPEMLVRVSLQDSQVPYWEGAKYVARLRAFNTGDRPVLLKVTFSAGHGGASGRYDAIRDTALNWAFVLGS